MRLSTLVVVLFLFPTAGVGGQASHSAQLAKVRSVIVSTDRSGDSVCLPTSAQLKAEAELVLRRAGLRVVDEGQNYTVLDVLQWTLAAAESADISATEAGRRNRDLYLNRPHRFEVSLVGLATGGRCAASYGFHLWRLELLAGNDPRDFVLAPAYQQRGLLTGPDMPRRLREETNAAATNLANEILKAREGG